jgi:hypothetical protein
VQKSFNSSKNAFFFQSLPLPFPLLEVMAILVFGARTEWPAPLSQQKEVNAVQDNCEETIKPLHFELQLLLAPKTTEAK